LSDPLLEPTPIAESAPVAEPPFVLDEPEPLDRLQATSGVPSRPDTDADGLTSAPPKRRLWPKKLALIIARLRRS
jgi:hypothetical protein